MADVARELLILGILRRGALSAYDVNRAVRGHAPLYRPLRRGNVYYALERLAKDGHVVRRAAKTKRGPSATKSVYQLSTSGEGYFRTLIRSALNDLQADDSTLEVAFVLLGQLSRREALEHLQQRHDAATDHERRLRRLLGDTAQLEGAARIGLSHAFHRARAEQQFVREAIDLLEDATWTPNWKTDDGPIVDPLRTL